MDKMEAALKAIRDGATTVHLWGNNIGDAGATALAAALEKNTSVTSVILYGARAWLGGRDGWMGGSGALGHAAAPAALARSDAEREGASALRVRARSV